MGIFDKLLEKNKTKKTLEIAFTQKGIFINGQEISFPTNISILNGFFGDPEIVKAKTNNIYLWQDKGIRGLSKDDQNIWELSIQIRSMEPNKFFPQQNFIGTIKIDGNDYQDFVKITRDDYSQKEYTIGDFTLYVDLTDDKPRKICGISIDKGEIESPAQNNDKYNLKKTVNDKIEIEDFNFKLAIIDQLMYNNDLLRPKFDIFEFVKLHNKRTIDIDEEGYAPIPEVVTYFENLEIDKKFASAITEIYQGGNDIYLNIIPFWDGEDDTFNIHSFEDTKHFPNLKKMTLFCTDKKIFEELKVKGIDAHSL